MTTIMRIGREAVLWLGAALGSLCLLSLLSGWLFNVTPLVFASGSMSPAYEAGALGLAHEVSATELEVGDVVSVVSVVDGQDQRVTHRIVELSAVGDSAVLTLQGDTNDVPDAESYTVTSVDRVAFGVPYVGYALNAAASPFGLLLAGLLVVGALWLGFGRRDDEPEASGSAPARVLVPTGVAGVVLAGTLLGASGTAPWAFTSAFWTDTATATTAASTPQLVTHAQPTCTSLELGARLTWTDVDDQYKYEWAVLELGGAAAPVGGGNPPPALNGVLGGGTTQGQTIQLNIPDTRGQGQTHKKNFIVRVTSRLNSNDTVVNVTETPIHREEASGGNIWRASCGHV